MGIEKRIKDKPTKVNKLTQKGMKIAYMLFLESRIFVK